MYYLLKKYYSDKRSRQIPISSWECMVPLHQVCLRILSSRGVYLVSSWHRLSIQGSNSQGPSLTSERVQDTGQILKLPRPSVRLVRSRFYRVSQRASRGIHSFIALTLFPISFCIPVFSRISSPQNLPALQLLCQGLILEKTQAETPCQA